MGAATSRDEVPAAASGAPLRVIVVEAAGRLAGELEAALAESPERRRLVLSTAPEPAALALLAAGEADVALLPIAAGGEGLAPLVKTRAMAPAVPVVVICGATDEALAVKAMQLGAADYLVRERLYGTVVVRSLRHAIEAERVRTVLARHQAEWPPALGGGSASRPAPLRVALPDVFAELVGRYGEILDLTVEHVLQRRPLALEDRLQELAATAAELRAGPRDVIDLHAAVMKQREGEQGAQRMKIYLAEGRLRVLELMGHLVTYYRDRWLAAQGPGPS
jgi:DNA-binding NarL/FixJ family response regulator